MKLLSIQNMASATEELNFEFYLILINWLKLSLNSHMGIMALILDRTAL